MSIGCAAHVSLEVTAAQIAAGDSSTWTKVGSLPDLLALMILNDLDAGGVKLKFWPLQGSAPGTPGAGNAEDMILAAGEPFFANYKNIGHIFGNCDVYVKSRTAEPASGSLRFIGVKRTPLKFNG